MTAGVAIGELLIGEFTVENVLVSGNWLSGNWLSGNWLSGNWLNVVVLPVVVVVPRVVVPLVVVCPVVIEIVEIEPPPPNEPKVPAWKSSRFGTGVVPSSTSGPGPVVLTMPSRRPVDAADEDEAIVADAATGVAMLVVTTGAARWIPWLTAFAVSSLAQPGH